MEGKGPIFSESLIILNSKLKSKFKTKIKWKDVPSMISKWDNQKFSKYVNSFLELNESGYI